MTRTRNEQMTTPSLGAALSVIPLIVVAGGVGVTVGAGLKFFLPGLNYPATLSVLAIAFAAWVVGIVRASNTLR